MKDPLGAFCKDEPVQQAGAFDGSLSGLRFAAKDLYDVAGFRTGGGNPDWRSSHEPATETAPAVQALLNAGADLAGKTITDEIAFSLNGENFHYGTPENPDAPGRIPGGSSSGSASAVAGQLVDFALGTDTGGSIRIPASFCGLYGLRPSHGAISTEGVIPLAPSFDTVGWFARDAGLMSRVGEVLLGEGETPELERVYFGVEVNDTVVPEAVAVARRGIARVAGVLGRMDELRFAPEGLRRWLDHFQALQWREIWECHREWIETARPRFGPGVAERFAATATVEDSRLELAKEFREEVTARLNDLLGDGAVVILPTALDIAPLKDLPPDELRAFRGRTLAAMSVAGMARLPQLSMPLCRSRGCPLGISLMAATGKDRLLLKLARSLEEHGVGRDAVIDNQARSR